MSLSCGLPALRNEINVLNNTTFMITKEDLLYSINFMKKVAGC